MLWTLWWNLVVQLRPACHRQKTFLWMILTLAAMSIRDDLSGVTSLIRTLGLRPVFYHHLLDFFHSPALDLHRLTMAWRDLVFRSVPGIIRCNGLPVIVGDGLKTAKSGKKMPSVKKLHQQSESNTKPDYIFGHSCQVVAVLAQALSSVFAIPLVCRIHEGVVFSNRDHRTLLDKMIGMLEELALPEPFIFVADAYYASGRVVRRLLDRNCHLVTRVKRNAVAYESLPPDPPGTRRRGRPRKYGRKIKLAALLQEQGDFDQAPSPLYGEKGVVIRFRTRDLLWRPVGILVRFVAVLHPTRGTILLMTSNLRMTPLEIIWLYGLRFKIEVSFKQALHVIGAYAYHFWMKGMTPLRRVSGNQHLHRKTAEYRHDVRRKIDAYHRHIQLGLIAQGLLHILSITSTTTVWRSFGSWIRTIRPGIPPSERVVSVALKNTLPELFADSDEKPIFTKFWQDRLDLDRIEGQRLAS